MASKCLERAKLLIGSGSYLFIIFQNIDFTLEEIVKYSTFDENINVTVNSKLQDELDQVKNPFADFQRSLNLSKEIDILEVFIRSLVSDRPDGMYATVVCDESNICLGLVYSNAQSIKRAVIEKKGIYWSRSRSSLWRKGDSSGMHQELLSIKYDCDRDALRFSVIQHGDPPAFCHLLTRSCWGSESGLQKLETTLKERKRDAPVGSYTKKLFDDPDLLRKKMLEEVQELVEAQDPDHIAAEAADVLYFVLTRCIAGGVGIREIEKHLNYRSSKVTRRPGLSKDWRTEEAERILKVSDK